MLGIKKSLGMGRETPGVTLKKVAEEQLIAVKSAVADISNRNEEEIITTELDEFINSLLSRYAIMQTIFQQSPDIAFNEALKELTLESNKENISDNEKKILNNYKDMIIELITKYLFKLSKDNQEFFKNFCIEVLKD